MDSTRFMLEHHPHPHPAWTGQLADALAALAECEQCCLFCADSCLDEENLEALRHCIRTDLICAAVCQAAARVLAGPSELATPLVHAQLHACVAACQACADECRRHRHEHCRICRDRCLHCQEACNLLLGLLSPAATNYV